MTEEQAEQREGLSRRALLNTAGAVGGTVLAASMLSGGAASAQTTTAPVTASRYALLVDGQEIATFTELAGIVAEVDPTDYWQTSASGPTISKLPGKQKPETIVLKRGMTGSLELWSWHQAVRVGQVAAARRNCSLVMYSPAGKPVVKYFLSNAWPSKIEMSTLKAGGSDVLMETVTLVAENLQRVAP
jgi:phage tail-like protein